VRVIVTCMPQTGHMLPLLPLAQAFAGRVDEVVVATGPDAAEAVTGRGLSFRAVGPAFGSWFAALRARARGVPGDGLVPSRVEGYFVPRLFGEIGTTLMVDDLLELCKESKPDLLVFDPYLFAAPLVAAATGAHAVLHTIGPLMDRSVLDLVPTQYLRFGESRPGGPSGRGGLLGDDAHDLPRPRSTRRPSGSAGRRRCGPPAPSRASCVAGPARPPGAPARIRHSRDLLEQQPGPVPLSAQCLGG
jgi:hypothetical protein